MAKTKKQYSAADKAAANPKPSAAGAAKKAPAAKEPATAAAKKSPATAAAKKPAKAEKTSGGTPPAPLIDTGLAAQTAAAMVAHRGAGTASGSASPSRPAESSTFKSLKDSVNTPGAGGLGGILGTGAGQKKFPPQFGGKQGGPAGFGGRNQTFGADVNRAGVPRRTGGG
jgi:hypothetical protein